jgi:hypothetical protein
MARRLLQYSMLIYLFNLIAIFIQFNKYSFNLIVIFSFNLILKYSFNLILKYLFNLINIHSILNFNIFIQFNVCICIQFNFNIHSINPKFIQTRETGASSLPVLSCPRIPPATQARQTWRMKKSLMLKMTCQCF